MFWMSKTDNLSLNYLDHSYWQAGLRAHPLELARLLVHASKFSDWHPLQMAEESVKRILLRGSRTSPLFASGQLNPSFPCKQVGDLHAGCPSRMCARGATHVTALRTAWVTFMRLWLLACESWMKRQQRRTFGMNMTQNKCTEAAICHWRR